MALARLADCDVLVVDGRSGSGKTSLAARLAGRSGGDASVLHVEDLYPGWDGLADGSRAVARALAEGGYRRYDWALGRFAEWVPLPRRVPLVIEGCGALTAANLAAARAWAGRAAGGGGRVRGVWIACPEPVRRARALARDGETFRPHWDRWAAQEDAHFAEHRPWELADDVLPCP